MSHNSKMKTNMERMHDNFAAAARMVGANLRKPPAMAREEDAARVSWRLNRKNKNGERQPLPPVKEFDKHRYEPGAGMEQFVETHTRKVTGKPLSQWTVAEKTTIRKFLESLDDIGTLAW